MLLGIEVARLKKGIIILQKKVHNTFVGEDKKVGCESCLYMWKNHTLDSNNGE